MFSVAELLEKAAEYDRLAGQALRPKEKAQNENLAACYRFLAEQTEMITSDKSQRPDAQTQLVASPFPADLDEQRQAAQNAA
jgi:hypothetical protein